MDVEGVGMVGDEDLEVMLVFMVITNSHYRIEDMDGGTMIYCLNIMSSMYFRWKSEISRGDYFYV